jgi:hypothetical protein
VVLMEANGGKKGQAVGNGLQGVQLLEQSSHRGRRFGGGVVVGEVVQGCDGEP